MRKVWLFTLVLVVSFLANLLAPNDSFATRCYNNDRFLGLPAWYNGLEGEKTGSGCVLTTEGLSETDLKAYVWTIAFNIVSIILGVAGYLAVIFVMIGGIRLMTSQGNPQGTVGARKTITNALIGLVICAIASTIANVVSVITTSARDAGTNGSEFFVTIANTILTWAGIIAVVMIIIGGVNYMTSTGDPGRVRKAKNTIVYAIAGLIITILAAVIVNTVLGVL